MKLNLLLFKCREHINGRFAFEMGDDTETKLAEGPLTINLDPPITFQVDIGAWEWSFRHEKPYSKSLEICLFA